MEIILEGYESEEENRERSPYPNESEDLYYIRAESLEETFRTKIPYPEEKAQSIVNKERGLLRVTSESYMVWHYREHPYFESIDSIT